MSHVFGPWPCLLVVAALAGSTSDALAAAPHKHVQPAKKPEVASAARPERKAAAKSGSEEDQARGACRGEAPQEGWRRRQVHRKGRTSAHRRCGGHEGRDRPAAPWPNRRCHRCRKETRRSGRPKARGMVHPSPFGLAGQLRPLYGVHHRQSRLARRHAAAPARRSALVERQDRRGNRARLYLRSPPDREGQARARTRPARRRRSRRRESPGAGGLSIGRSVGTHRVRSARGLPRPARSRRRSGPHGQAYRREGPVGGDACGAPPRRRRGVDRQGLQRGQGQRRQGIRPAQFGRGRCTAGPGLCAVPRAMAEEQGEDRRGRPPDPGGAERDHGAAGHG